LYKSMPPNKKRWAKIETKMANKNFT